MPRPFTCSSAARSGSSAAIQLVVGQNVARRWSTAPLEALVNRFGQLARIQALHPARIECVDVAAEQGLSQLLAQARFGSELSQTSLARRNGECLDRAQFDRGRCVT